MSPLWAAKFHPVDDHEFAAMLSLHESSIATRLFVRFVEMSPAEDFPNGAHWRPAVWLARALESEVFGTHVHLYFFWRNLLLAILGLLAAGFALAIREVLQQNSLSSFSGVVAATILSLIVVSTPVLFDVFGRLLPGEMYTLIGLLTWLMAWTRLVSCRRESFTPSAKLLSLFWVGLVLMTTGKEDAAFLWPTAFLLSLPEILFLRESRPLAIFLSVVSTGALWLAAGFQTFRTVFLSSAGLPYHMQKDTGFRQIVDGLTRINNVQLAFALCAIALIALWRRKVSGDIIRIMLFIASSLLLELVYVSSVPVGVPRYSAAILVLTSLMIFCAIAVHSATVRSSTLNHRGVTAFFLAVLFPLMAIGAGHQRTNNILYRDISLNWNNALSDIHILTQQSEFKQILLVVDPPDANSVGRWEKSYSFAKSMRLLTDSRVRNFMVVMDPRARGVLPSVDGALRETSLLGTKDAAGYIFYPISLLQDVESLCVLYTDSGRTFPYLEKCGAVYRMTL